MASNSVCKVATRLGIAAIFIFFGLSMYHVFYPLAIQYVVENKLMILYPKSKFFQEWSNLQEPMKCEIYLFELKNARDFLLGKKPQVAEHGPFVFNHYKKVSNITWLDRGKKISFYETSIYNFDRAESVAGLDDYNITTVNLALMTTMNTLWRETQSGILNVISGAANSFAKGILSSNSEFIAERRTPGQILVGRRAHFMDQIERYMKLANTLGFSTKSSLTEMKQIGYLKFSNNTINGPTIMYTGLRSFSELFEEFVHHNRNNAWVRCYADLFGYSSIAGEEQLDEAEVLRMDQQFDRNFMRVESAEGKKYYGKYLRPSCNEIRGTDGAANNPYLVQEHKSFYVHSPFCRPLKLQYESKKWYNTLNYVNEYTLASDTFDSTKQNWCFCPGVKAVRQPAPGDRRTCTRNRRRGGITCRIVSPSNSTVLYKVTGDLDKCTGYHDMSICNEYLPVAITFPHFMNARRLQKTVDGLDHDPDSIDHRSYFDIEPHFGITMEAKIRLQVNVQVHPAASVTGLNKFKPTIMPYLRITEFGKMGSEARKALFMCVMASYLGYGVCITISLIGVLIMVLVIFSCRTRKGKTDEQFDEFGEAIQKKSKFAIHFDPRTDAEALWKRKEQFKSQLRTGRKQIMIKKNELMGGGKLGSSSSLNQMLPNKEMENYSNYAHFQNHKSVSLNSINVHGNRIYPNLNPANAANGMTPLG